MTPQQAYVNAIAHHNFTANPVQAKAVLHTERLFQQLIAQTPETEFSSGRLYHLWLRLRNYISGKPHSPMGIYFWGGVGTGKTWLMDSFFNALPFAEKQRIHFHAFMQDIHHQLKILPKSPDPLPIIAEQMAQNIRLLCIDEFHVQDITDAMLLSGLLKALFEQEVVLVTTSNSAPDELYKNGLQRSSFLPAIQLIKTYTQAFELNHGTDYRTLVLEKEGCYHSPLTQYHRDMMAQHFIKISSHAPLLQQQITVNKRIIEALALNHASRQHPQTVIWFDFEQLCKTARSSADYLFIARQYPCILLSDVYQMDENSDDIAKRFIHLIDALYDQHCTLVINAATEPDELYLGRQLKRSFLRTASRLKEMRSKLYRGKQVL